MGDNTVEIEKTIWCMAKENLNGKMAEDMKVAISMIKSMDMDVLNGPMEEDIVVNGLIYMVFFTWIFIC